MILNRADPLKGPHDSCESDEGSEDDRNHAHGQPDSTAALKPWPVRRRLARGQVSAAGRDKAFVLAPTPVQFLDLIWRSVAGEVSQACPSDVPDAVRGTCREVHGCVRSEDLLLVTGQHLSSALENIIHRFHRAMLVEPRASARTDVHQRDDEFSRADVAGSDDLIGQAPVPLESLRLLSWYDLHRPAVVCKVQRAFGVSVSGRAAEGLKGVR